MSATLSEDVMSLKKLILRNPVSFMYNNNNNNNNNNSLDNVHGAVIITAVISRVHLVHLMNVEYCLAAADPQTTTWAVSLPVGCYCDRLRPPSPFIITQPGS